MIRQVFALAMLCALAAHANGSRIPDQELKLLPAAARANALPVVLWHGMGDSCCSLGSVGSIKKLIEDKLGALHGHAWVQPLGPACGQTRGGCHV